MLTSIVFKILKIFYRSESFHISGRVFYSEWYITFQARHGPQILYQQMSIYTWVWDLHPLLHLTSLSSAILRINYTHTKTLHFPDRFRQIMKVFFLTALIAAVALAQEVPEDVAKSMSRDDSSARLMGADPPPIVHTISNKDCPCKCDKKNVVSKQCKPFLRFCELSSCKRKNGRGGQRCCRKSTGGFGSCECNGSLVTIGLSFTSEASARAAAASACSDRSVCPPNCNCGTCPVLNILCISSTSPCGDKVWSCRSDCSFSTTTGCQRILGRR